MSWIWKTKTMGWVEQKLIDITTTIYMKRREPDPTVAPLRVEPIKKTRKSTKPAVKKARTRSQSKET